MNRHARAALVLMMSLALGGEAQAAGLQRHFYTTGDDDSLTSLRAHARDLDLPLFINLVAVVCRHA